MGRHEKKSREKERERKKNKNHEKITKKYKFKGFNDNQILHND